MLRFVGLFCADNDNHHIISNYDYNHNRLNSRRLEYIMPRELCGTYKNYWFSVGRDIRNISDFVMVPWRYLDSFENKSNTECSECPFNEDCNGQMCFFSMI